MHTLFVQQAPSTNVVMYRNMTAFSLLYRALSRIAGFLLVVVVVGATGLLSPVDSGFRSGCGMATGFVTTTTIAARRRTLAPAAADPFHSCLRSRIRRNPPWRIVSCWVLNSSASDDNDDDTTASEKTKTVSQQDAMKIAESSKNPEDIILDEERRHNLFQFLLRDLQVEGVPLLAVDADQVDSTLQAALWTTMAELLTGWKAQKGRQKEKACLIFEHIPIEALREFVQDFENLQTQGRLMKQLPELSWFHLELVGKGVGLAIVVTVEPISKTGKDTKDISVVAAGLHLSDDFLVPDDEAKLKQQQPPLEERKLIAAMKMFVDRVACGMEMCPHFNFDVEVQASRTNYKVCSFVDVCHVLSAFWNGICELQTTPADQLSAVMLLLPAITEMKTTRDEHGRFVTGPEQQHARFAAVAELISRSLCLCRGNEIFDVFHFYPNYDRDNVHPPDQPAFGHLPPNRWLRPILNKYNDLKGVNDSDRRVISDTELTQLANYQRRSPVTAVCIKRVAMMKEHSAKDPDAGMVELEIGGGADGKNETITARSVPYYASNILRLAETGKEALQSELDEEIAISKS